MPASWRASARRRSRPRSLNHPNVVNVFDYGTDEAGPFIVMELVAGENLAEILHDRGFLPPLAAAGIAQQIAEGL